MQIANNIGKHPKAAQAIILWVIGVSGSLGLIIFGIIGEVSFITLIFLFSVISFIVFFRDTIESFNLREGSIKLKTVEAMIAKETEPLKFVPLKLTAFITDADTKSVIKAIGSTKYTWHYFDNIVANSNLTPDIVKDKLNWLLINMLATEENGIDNMVYGLSPEGRNLFNAIEATKKHNK